MSLASIRAQQGQQKEAFELYTLAASNGSREAVENAVALAVRNSGDPERLERAKGVVDAALKSHPNDADLLTKKGFLLHYERNYEEEVRLYEQALLRNPNDFKFLNNMAWSLSEGMNQPKKALERINEAFDKAGVFPQFLDTRGVILTRLNQLPPAIKDLEAAALSSKGTPSYGAIQFHLARAYHLAGRKDDARLALERARAAGLKVQSLEPKERTELDDLSAKLVAVAKP